MFTLHYPKVVLITFDHQSWFDVLVIKEYLEIVKHIPSTFVKQCSTFTGIWKSIYKKFALNLDIFWKIIKDLLFKPEWHTYPVATIFLCFYGYHLTGFFICVFPGKVVFDLKVVVLKSPYITTREYYGSFFTTYWSIMQRKRISLVLHAMVLHGAIKKIECCTCDVITNCGTNY